MLVFGIMDGLLVGLSRVKQSAAARGQVAPAAAAACLAAASIVRPMRTRISSKIVMSSSHEASVFSFVASVLHCLVSASVLSA